MPNEYQSELATSFPGALNTLNNSISHPHLRLRPLHLRLPLRQTRTPSEVLTRTKSPLHSPGFPADGLRTGGAVSRLAQASDRHPFGARWAGPGASGWSFIPRSLSARIDGADDPEPEDQRSW